MNFARQTSARSASCSLGFSLIELLVVMAIVGILVALIMPAIQSAREQSRRTSCLNNHRQVALAILNYAGNRSGKLPAMWRTDDPSPWKNFSWRATILPYLEHQATYDQLVLTESPLDPVNQPLLKSMVATYQCPSVPASPRLLPVLGREGESIYEVVAAAHDMVAVYDVEAQEQTIYAYRGAWHGGRGLPISWIGQNTIGDVPLAPESARNRVRPSALRKVHDGHSKTALLVEQAGKPAGLGSGNEASAHSPSEGAWATCDVGSFYGNPVNTYNYYDPFGFHSGAVIAMCDASVSLISESTSVRVIEALLSRDGNEIMSAEDWQLR